MNLIWTSLAEKSYNQNIEYLLEEWSLKVVQHFILEVERTMNIVKESPNCFQEWEFDKTFRMGLIHENISFFYKIHTTEIVVYLFWNNLQNPKKLKKQLLKP